MARLAVFLLVCLLCCSVLFSSFTTDSLSSNGAVSAMPQRKKGKAQGQHKKKKNGQDDPIRRPQYSRASSTTIRGDSCPQSPRHGTAEILDPCDIDQYNAVDAVMRDGVQYVDDYHDHAIRFEHGHEILQELLALQEGQQPARESEFAFPIVHPVHPTYATLYQKLLPGRAVPSMRTVKIWQSQMQKDVIDYILALLKVFEHDKQAWFDARPGPDAMEAFGYLKTAFLYLGALEHLLRFGDVAAVLKHAGALKRFAADIWQDHVLLPLNKLLQEGVKEQLPVAAVFDTFGEKLAQFGLQMPDASWQNNRFVGETDALSTQDEFMLNAATKHVHILNQAMHLGEAQSWSTFFGHYWSSHMPLVSHLCHFDVWLLDFAKILHAFDHALLAFKDDQATDYFASFVERLRETSSLLQERELAPILALDDNVLQIDNAFAKALTHMDPKVKSAVGAWPQALWLGWNTMSGHLAYLADSGGMARALGLPEDELLSWTIDIGQIRHGGDPRVEDLATQLAIQTAHIRYDWARRFEQPGAVSVGTACQHWRKVVDRISDDIKNVPTWPALQSIVTSATDVFQTVARKLETSTLRSHLADDAKDIPDDHLLHHVCRMELEALCDAEAEASMPKKKKKKSKKKRIAVKAVPLPESALPSMHNEQVPVVDDVTMHDVDCASICAKDLYSPPPRDDLIPTSPAKQEQLISTLEAKVLEEDYKQIAARMRVYEQSEHFKDSDRGVVSPEMRRHGRRWSSRDSRYDEMLSEDLQTLRMQRMPTYL